MANSKNFVVKNPVEVSDVITFNAGTNTSNDLDLSTGNSFTADVDDSATFTFSNPSEAQNFTLDVTANSIYSVSGFTYEGLSRQFSGIYQNYNAGGTFVAPDGTKFYHNSRNLLQISTFNFGTPWSMSSNPSAGPILEYDIAGPSSNGVYGFYIKPDGTKLYVTDVNSEQIKSLDLTTPWDISTATSDQAFTVTYLNPYAITFKPDGTEMYVVEYDTASATNYYAVQYTLSTPWDITTASFTGQAEIVAQQYCLQISEDGKRLAYGTGYFYIYNLTTPWDITSLSLVGSINPNVVANQPPYSGFFKTDGTKFYSLQGDITPTTQYILSFTTIGDTTLTWPASVEWQNGSAGSGPSGLSTASYGFSTDDGGTTYQGRLKSATPAL